MNYILHLTAFYSKLYNDRLLTPCHVSLYMAIFQTWNLAHFENPIYVDRSYLMRLSKIGSVNTYIRCLKQLHTWKFICYEPSHSMIMGSRITVITFDNTTDNTSETRVRHYIKHSKTNTNITIKEVEEFFEKEKFDRKEAARFFNHYEANGWMMGSVKIQNWQAAAINWMLNFQKFNSNEKSRSAVHKEGSNPRPGHLSATTNKKYDEPL